MAKITLAIGLTLVLLGVVLYLTSDLEAARKWTALIPAFFGLPVAVLGAVALNGSENVRKHTAHVAVMITLLGTLGGLGMGIPRLIREPEATAGWGQLVMGVLCAVHVVLSVRSFIAARKARQSQGV